MDDSISLKHLIIYLCTIFMYVPVGNCALIVEECCYVTHVRIVQCTSTNVCYLDAESISTVQYLRKEDKNVYRYGYKYTKKTTFYACMDYGDSGKGGI